MTTKEAFTIKKPVSREMNAISLRTCAIFIDLDTLSRIGIDYIEQVEADWEKVSGKISVNNLRFMMVQESNHAPVLVTYNGETYPHVEDIVSVFDLEGDVIATGKFIPPRVITRTDPSQKELVRSPYGIIIQEAIIGKSIAEAVLTPDVTPSPKAIELLDSFPQIIRINNNPPPPKPF